MIMGFKQTFFLQFYSSLRIYPKGGHSPRGKLAMTGMLPNLKHILV